MSAASEEAWFVILTDGPPREVAEAATLVASAKTRLTRFDALRAFRTDSGLLPSPLPRAEARAIASALSSGGVGALAIPGARLQFPAPPRAIPWASPEAEGLRVTLGWLDAPTTIPWHFIHAWRLARVLPSGGTRDLVRLQARAAQSAAPPPKPTPASPAAVLTKDELVSLGVAAASEALSWLVDVPFAEAWAVARGLSHAKSGDADANLQPQAPPAREPEPELWLDLCGLDPPLRLRIRQATFDYKALGAARGLSSRVNFSALLRLFAPHLSHAQACGQVDEALAGRLGADEDEAEQEREHDLALLGVLTRIALRGPSGA